MPLTPDIRRRLLEAGVLAPSGDNLQPWIAQWHDGTLHLSVDPARDRSLYNFRFRASLIALGAMIENIAIEASEYGLATIVSYSDKGQAQLTTATLEFAESDRPPDPLRPFLARRCTNRKGYDVRPLPTAMLQGLRDAISGWPGAELRFVTDRRQMRIVARAASLNDRLLFELRPLHDIFFECLRWTAAEAERTRDGLFIKTLELGPMAPGFKAMRAWRLVRVARLIGSSRLAPLHSYLTFLHSPAFGFLQMPSTSPGAFVEGGRALQRVWLAATSLGLSVQPMVGMLYLLCYLRPDAGVDLDPSHRRLLERAARLFAPVLPLHDQNAAIMLFRLGFGPAPSATSLRREI
jgi:hypothetical protein